MAVWYARRPRRGDDDDDYDDIDDDDDDDNIDDDIDDDDDDDNIDDDVYRHVRARALPGGRGVGRGAWLSGTPDAKDADPGAAGTQGHPHRVAQAQAAGLTGCLFV